MIESFHAPLKVLSSSSFTNLTVLYLHTDKFILKYNLKHSKKAENPQDVHEVTTKNYAHYRATYYITPGLFNDVEDVRYRKVCRFLHYSTIIASTSTSTYYSKAK